MKFLSIVAALLILTACQAPTSEGDTSNNLTVTTTRDTTRGDTTGVVEIVKCKP